MLAMPVMALIEFGAIAPVPKGTKQKLSRFAELPDKEGFSVCGRTSNTHLQMKHKKPRFQSKLSASLGLFSRYTKAGAGFIKKKMHTTGSHALSEQNFNSFVSGVYVHTYICTYIHTSCWCNHTT